MHAPGARAGARAAGRRRPKVRRHSLQGPAEEVGSQLVGVGQPGASHKRARRHPAGIVEGADTSSTSTGDRTSSGGGLDAPGGGAAAAAGGRSLLPPPELPPLPLPTPVVSSEPLSARLESMRLRGSGGGPGRPSPASPAGTSTPASTQDTGPDASASLLWDERADAEGPRAVDSPHLGPGRREELPESDFVRGPPGGAPRAAGHSRLQRLKSDAAEFAEDGGAGGGRREWSPRSRRLPAKKRTLAGHFVRSPRRHSVS
mmetsp:Transcript_21789/g.74045  ORF Transcript_21789/g.74045 Transcript_21789/m.74045 type:complete len:259 (-) Transcript_21789:551-1327(-)